MSERKISKKSLENLRPPKKGEPSRNPKGRPKKEFTIPDILRRMALEPSEYDPEQIKTRLEKICEKALAQAQGGDKDARSWVADRMEGKAVERVLTQETDDDLIIL